MTHEFTKTGHERAQRAGQATMAKLERDKRKPPFLWRWFTNLLLLTQFAAITVAIVAFFHPVTFGFGGGGGTLAQAMTWPALISPHWGALLAAIGAFVVAGIIWAPGRDGGSR